MSNWKGGKPKCLNCGKLLTSYYAKKCVQCYNLKENNPNWGGGHPKCIECSVILSDYNSKRCRKCYTKTIIREKNSNWKGGKSSLYHIIRTCEKHVVLMEESKKRDNYQCLMPGCKTEKYSDNLNSNHIKLFSKIIEENNIKIMEDAYKCDELWNSKNLITLCKDCHKYIRGREQEFKNLFIKILNKLYYGDK